MDHHFADFMDGPQKSLPFIPLIDDPVSSCLCSATFSYSGGPLSLEPLFWGSRAEKTSSYEEIFLVPADPADGCSDLKDDNNIQGQVILVLRGGCSFVQKAQHVEEAGGKAVLIADNAEDNDSLYLDMVSDGSDAQPTIPALFLLGRDGLMIRRALQRQALPWAVITIPVNVSALGSFPLKQPPWTLW
uniref:PA domain-containing protein n=1 Tax=Gouania willdenowi TaxID=441366 RepID=A0A8C5GWE4_GOUWI